MPQLIPSTFPTISIHALRGEGDAARAGFLIYFSNISIYALRGEGDLVSIVSNTFRKYFNPRPPWGGRRQALSADKKKPTISIHALRGEGD